MSILKYASNERHSGWRHAATPRRAADLLPVFGVTHVVTYRDMLLIRSWKTDKISGGKTVYL